MTIIIIMFFICFLYGINKMNYSSNKNNLINKYYRKLVIISFIPNMEHGIEYLIMLLLIYNSISLLGIRLFIKPGNTF